MFLPPCNPWKPSHNKSVLGWNGGDPKFFREDRTHLTRSARPHRLRRRYDMSIPRHPETKPDHGAQPPRQTSPTGCPDPLPTTHLVPQATSTRTSRV